MAWHREDRSEMDRRSDMEAWFDVGNRLFGLVNESVIPRVGDDDADDLEWIMDVLSPHIVHYALFHTFQRWLARKLPRRTLAGTWTRAYQQDGGGLYPWLYGREEEEEEEEEEDGFAVIGGGHVPYGWDSEEEEEEEEQPLHIPLPSPTEVLAHPAWPVLSTLMPAERAAKHHGHLFQD